MTIKAELNYLDFHNTKDKLEDGFYRVIESDGEENIALVKANSWNGPCRVTWMSEMEYLEHRRMDSYLSDDWDREGNEFRRISPEDLADVDLSEDLMDSWDQAMAKKDDQRLCDEICLAEVDVTAYLEDLTDTEFVNLCAQGFESNQHQSECFNRDMEAKKDVSLADLLREAISIDPRHMTNEQYVERCEIAAQDKRDGVSA
ncbi:hypothetical protein ST201phi2-1p008 [Pseudomonas phage 201phi2-1]|uniref:Uncharacterized protein n=1 Tax=Pseudomonas phage 201phi2-1 TaxID=198110 RepID=B3FJY4_BP201|nr:hypothetical protein ST201phi2-1p008 [Pseudomonas phage 201phi2-1]ABY62842.1 hypothetical protein 201phi2-1p008 [Pseudomonas phage 201phi2-1]